MPQLNPTPWFSYMVFAWLVFLIFIPQKVLTHVSPNSPHTQETKYLKAESWAWPWH
uniref:ATP synthase complex subunit 8 n=1 Tax=Pronothobranchius seymouri TaxID=2064664 RepID=A0A518DK04_9TELE|nr:ATP synthase F0 subunit 8 [Pronothobranchius seymouri]QDU91796.1 ATP synthase F0 subunit 8 [Pronothobranchius seymouri]